MFPVFLWGASFKIREDIYPHFALLLTMNHAIFFIWADFEGGLMKLLFSNLWQINLGFSILQEVRAVDMWEISVSSFCFTSHKTTSFDPHFNIMIIYAHIMTWFKFDKQFHWNILPYEGEMKKKILKETCKSKIHVL